MGFAVRKMLRKGGVSMSSLSNQLIRKNELSEQDITAMYQLMDSFYENITPKEFLRTLAKKDYIFLVKDQFAFIQAFTTLQLLHIPGRKQKVYGILAGDIITHKDYVEDRNIFTEALMEYQLRQKKQKDSYIFLTCKDCWTFKIFQESFTRCYPNKNEEMPLQVKKLINSFGEYYYSQEYESATGIIKHSCFPRKIKESRLKKMEKTLSEEERAFFVHKNPEYKKGYDLICVAELPVENQILSFQNINQVIKV